MWLHNKAERTVDNDSVFLFMRKTGDGRADHIVKREIWENEIKGKFFIEFILDDRNSVVRLYREMGLTVMQVAPGDF